MLSHLKRKFYHCTNCNLSFKTYEHFDIHKNLYHSSTYRNQRNVFWSMEMPNRGESSDTSPEEVDQQNVMSDEYDLSDESNPEEDPEQSDYDDYYYDEGSDYEESLRKAKRKCNRTKQRMCRKNGSKTYKSRNPKVAFCSICKSGFTTEKYLKIHMHKHNVVEMSCKICYKSFKTNSELKEHNKSHKEKKPFLCGTCGMRYNRQAKLIEHSRVHAKEKPFICSYCGEQFAQEGNLKTHTIKHEGEKFFCGKCGKGYIKKYHMLYHKRTVHKKM